MQPEASNQSSDHTADRARITAIAGSNFSPKKQWRDQGHRPCDEPSTLETARVHIENKLDDSGHVHLLVVEDRQMTTNRTKQIATFLHVFSDLFHLGPLHGAIARADGEGKHVDLRKVGGSIAIEEFPIAPISLSPCIGM